MIKPFHMSLGVRSVDDSVDFFVNVLRGEVTHRDPTGYVNLELFGSQITLKCDPNIQVKLPHFHFGFNLSLKEFDALSSEILEKNSTFVEMKPKVVDAGTEMERKKMYLKCPTGYLIELKGYH